MKEKEQKQKNDDHAEEVADIKAEAKEESLSTNKTSSMLKYALKLLLWVAATGLIFSLVVYFTPLRFTAKVNPIESAVYNLKSAAATTDVERAHFHISESERLNNELKRVKKSTDLNTLSLDSFYTMLWHNEEAVKYMLAAEKTGTDLEQEGLIERLCDSLGEQYALRHDLQVSDIPEVSTLSYRVEKGEELEKVFDQIQEQINEAMHW